MSLSRASTIARVAFAAWAVSFALPAQGQSGIGSADAPAAPAAQLQRGTYVYHLGGCEGCHTDKKGNGPVLAGGRAFKTDFGTFYSPNITPDASTGIGRWTFEDFKNAMRHGEAPDGSNYFPAFPYTSYTHMTDRDLEDLWAYLSAQPAVDQANRDHDLKPVFGWRWLVTFWNWLYLDTGPKPDWPRGHYVAEALSHCHECHTPRDMLGGRDDANAYAGTPRNPEGLKVPNVTPHDETGIGKWSDGDLKMLFTIGMLPDGDFVGGVMAESVTHATSKMTDADRQALIEYLRALPPVENQIGKKKSGNSGDSEWY